MRLRGPWTLPDVEDFLSRTRKPLRLACRGASGHPVLASLWFLPDGEGLWCATQRSARIVELLADDERCAFEVAIDEMPYRGVRGQGTARLHPERGAGILERLIERYLEDPRSEFAAWLRSRAGDETAIEILPERLLSWDFRERMSGAEAS